MVAGTSSLARYVVSRRGGLGLSQTELARRAGLSKSELNAVEKGRVTLPGADKRRRLAAALGVTHQALLVAAGELTEDEVGDAVLAYRPPFAEDDVRARVVALLRVLGDNDAKAVMVLAKHYADMRGAVVAEDDEGGPREAG